VGVRHDNLLGRDDRLSLDVSGSEGLVEIVREFGEDVLAGDRSLDRQRLGAIVFDDPERRRTLERITHPRIAARSAERLAELSRDGPPYVLYEAALLVENGVHRSLPALVVVSADEETRIRRVMERDGLDARAARARLAAQLPLADKVAVADHVIDNGGSLEQTRRQVRAVHDALVRRLGGEAT